MRILFLSTWFPYPPDNGARIRTYYLLRALAQSHEVRALAFCPPPGPAGPCSSATGDVPVQPVLADPFRFVTLPSAIKFLSPTPVSMWPSRAMEKAVSAIAQEAPPHAVVGLGTQAARYLSRFTSAARVLDIDTSLSYQLHQRLSVQSTPGARLRTYVSLQKAYRCEKHHFRRFHACSVASTHELGFVQEMIGGMGSEITVIPNGADCIRNRPGLASRQPQTLIYSGALTYSANYDAMRYFLDEIYPLIRRQSEGVSLTITGSTSGVDLNGLRLDGSVKLSGYVDDVRPIVAGSAVCVVPLREGGGTRLKILEAMALGTPVISTTKGAEGLDVLDGIHLLLADEPAQFAALTLRLLNDAYLAESLVRNARRLVEQRYDWQAIGQRFVDLVEDTAARQKGAAYAL